MRPFTAKSTLKTGQNPRSFLDSSTASGKKSKRSRYHVADEFLRFWFRYVESNRSSIEEAPAIVYDGTIEPDLTTHVASTFGDVPLKLSGR